MNTKGQSFLKQTDLFESSGEGYAQIRIPGMVITRKGTILAYCEARDKTSDWANIDICLRRSFDGGITWGDKRVIVSGISSGHTINNPVMIASGDSDIIHFLFCREYAECFYCRSYDEGNTWTSPIEITNTFEKFKPEYPWKVIATGPCHGIQTASHRLIVPVWLALEKAHHPSVVSTIYSDDNGDTWNRGEIIYGSQKLINPGEPSVVELMDGRIIMNMRNSSSDKRRSVTISNNGYEGWSGPVFDEQLIDPGCCASLARYNQKDIHKGNCILFSNCNSETERKALTIRGSLDNGKSWPVAKILYPGGAAYSDIAVSADGTIYCFYERFTDTEPYKYLTMARFNLQWLTE